MSREYVTTGFASKFVKADDDYAYVAFKADVQNNSEFDSVDVEIQGLDGEGFEVVSCSIYGNISPGQTKSITTREMIELDDFNMVVEWRVA